MAGINFPKKQNKPILVNREVFQLINQYKADNNLKNKSDVIKDAISKAKTCRSNHSISLSDKDEELAL